MHPRHPQASQITSTTTHPSPPTNTTSHQHQHRHSSTPAQPPISTSTTTYQHHFQRQHHHSSAPPHTQHERSQAPLSLKTSHHPSLPAATCHRSMPPTTHHLPLRPVTIAGITIQGCPRASALHGQQDQCGKPSPQQRTTMSGISYCHATMSTGFLLPTFIKASHETFMNDTHAKPPGFFFIVLARLTAVLPSGDIFFIGFPRECSPHRSYHCSMAIISTMFNAWLV